MAGALTKLLLRLRKSTNAEGSEVNKLTAEAMLYIVSILRLGESQASLHPRDDDAVDRMVTCLKVRLAWISGNLPTQHHPASLFLSVDLLLLNMLRK